MYNVKKYIFHLLNKNRNKNNYNKSNKEQAKIFSNFRGNTCVAEPNLEVLSLT